MINPLFAIVFLSNIIYIYRHCKVQLCQQLFNSMQNGSSGYPTPLCQPRSQAPPSFPLLAVRKSGKSWQSHPHDHSQHFLAKCILAVPSISLFTHRESLGTRNHLQTLKALLVFLPSQHTPVHMHPSAGNYSVLNWIITQELIQVDQQTSVCASSLKLDGPEL